MVLEVPSPGDWVRGGWLVGFSDEEQPVRLQGYTTMLYHVRREVYRIVQYTRTQLWYHRCLTPVEEIDHPFTHDMQSLRTATFVAKVHAQIVGQLARTYLSRSL